MARLYLAIIIFGIIGGVGWFGYQYYVTSQNTIRTLTANNAKLETAVATSENTIASMERSAEELTNQLNFINEQYASIRRQNQRLAERLSNVDLGLAAQDAPDKIGPAVNAGTKNAGRCFEILSGSLLTEEERNAPDEITFNKECPWLWPGHSTE